MMGQRQSIALLALIAMVPASAALGQGSDQGSKYFDRGSEGWFWYEPDPPPPPVPEKPAPTPPPEPVVVETPKIALQPPQDDDDVELVPLSAAWFRANLDGFRDRALDDPSTENVQAYLYLQRIALERAGNFAEASAAAAVKDPFLDANSERPIATYAAQAVDAQADAARTTVLSELAKEAGILFFYKESCPLCDSQAGVLKLAEDIHGFEIIAVSLDDSPPSGGLETHRRDDGQAENLGVVALPATFLVRPPDLVAPLAQAALDLKTLGRRIIGQAHTAGLIPDETYNATRAIQKPFILPDNIGDLPAEVMEDPARLVAHLRAKLGISGSGDQP